MSTESTEALVSKLLPLLRHSGEGDGEVHVRALVEELARRPTDELVAHVASLLAAIDAAHTARGGSEACDRVAALVARVGATALVHEARAWVDTFGETQPRAAMDARATMIRLGTVFPVLAPLAHACEAPRAPATLAPASGRFKAYVEAWFAAIATHLGKSPASFRASFGQALERALAADAPERGLRIVPFIEREGALLRAVYVVHEAPQSLTHGIAIATMRELGEEVAAGALVSFRVPTALARDSSAGWLSARFARALDDLLGAGSAEALAKVQPVSVALSPAPHLELTPFTVTAFRRVVDAVSDPETEISLRDAEELSGELQLGDEFGGLAPEATFDLLTEVTLAIYPEGMFRHLAIDHYAVATLQRRARLERCFHVTARHLSLSLTPEEELTLDDAILAAGHTLEEAIRWQDPITRLYDLALGAAPLAAIAKSALGRSPATLVHVEGLLPFAWDALHGLDVVTILSRVMATLPGFVPTASGPFLYFGGDMKQIPVLWASHESVGLQVVGTLDERDFRVWLDALASGTMNWTLRTM